MTLSDYLVSLVRTGVPVLAGLVLARLGINGLNVDGVTAQTAISILAVAGYYALVRALESKWSKVGILLGWAVTPNYDKPAPTEPSVPAEGL
jgi:hypothetical protein